MTKFKVPPKTLICNRMINRPTRQKYKEFRVDYAQTAREDNGQLVEVVDTAGGRLALLVAQVQFREEKLQKAKCEEKEAISQLRLLNHTMIDRVLGKNDPQVIAWNDTMVMPRRNEKHQRKSFEELMEKRLQTIPN
mmetsp:Transcript_21426/g.23959  ORF Transcript_21426/g.23959 Transcript_21426/m.23959 type:complete len:136 (+) Transcript_21426:50-457(+)